MGGVLRWMREARLLRESLVQSLVFEHWLLVLALEQPSLVQSLALEWVPCDCHWLLDGLGTVICSNIPRNSYPLFR